MPLTRIVLAGLTLVFLFSACKKEDFPEIGDKVLQRVVSDKDSLMSSTFHYDAQNRLVELIDSNRQGHIWQTAIDYNSGGNSVKITTQHHWQSNSVDGGTVDSLVYENGRVIKKLQKWSYYSSPIPSSFHVTNTYAYDTKGRLITDYRGNSNRIDEVYGYTNFTYDADDNVTKIQEFKKSSGVMDSAQRTIITYNSETNPYNSIGLTLYFVTEDPLLLGKHNKTEVVNYLYYDYFQRHVEGLTTEYAYQYDSDGLLKEMFISRTQGGLFNSAATYNFYYQ
jgi:hypothetical protein